MLQKECGRFGEFSNLTLHSFAEVTFCDPKTARTAFKRLNGKQVGDYSIRIEYAQNDEAATARFLAMEEEMEEEDGSEEVEEDDVALDDYGSDGADKGDQDQRSNQEYVMAQFKSFDEIAVRFVTQYVDRRDRKISHHRQYQHHGAQRNKLKGMEEMKLAEEPLDGY